MLIVPLCLDCKHLDKKAPKGVMRCDAFSAAIPAEILMMKHDHHYPYPGDHGIRFEEEK